MKVVDDYLSNYLTYLYPTNTKIKVPTTYYLVMASYYKNTQSMATKILTRLKVLETDSDLIEIF